MSEFEFVPKIIVKCPVCYRRIFDVVKGTKGAIVIKCPSCRTETKINLSFRLSNSNNKYYTRKCS